MGDHRCRIKIEFEIHGETSETEMEIDYYPYGDVYGVDRRITDWFHSEWDGAYCRYLFNQEEKKEDLAKDYEL